MIKTIKKINRWYDELPEPKRLFILVIPMLILLIIKDAIGVFHPFAGDCLFSLVVGFLIWARLRGK